MTFLKFYLGLDDLINSWNVKCYWNIYILVLKLKWTWSKNWGCLFCSLLDSKKHECNFSFNPNQTVSRQSPYFLFAPSYLLNDKVGIINFLLKYLLNLHCLQKKKSQHSPLGSDTTCISRCGVFVLFCLHHCLPHVVCSCLTTLLKNIFQNAIHFEIRVVFHKMPFL